ncbi:hypothetical protein CKO25_06060 [Thiocapsa imhoffii]|uniref:TonB C-terminal domain-containing protein n=1 Tax=Thiocapsa imhoffii TaxID=382777 RepID=A0A9X1B7V1_9GAMM|nr:energy transducer TonB [Thiocapsa imhoffii]MBK1644224.1 hypothetical protein [Thiocapsa imhoffii]
MIKPETELARTPTSTAVLRFPLALAIATLLHLGVLLIILRAPIPPSTPQSEAATELAFELFDLPAGGSPQPSETLTTPDVRPALPAEPLQDSASVRADTAPIPVLDPAPVTELLRAPPPKSVAAAPLADPLSAITPQEAATRQLREQDRSTIDQVEPLPAPSEIQSARTLTERELAIDLEATAPTETPAPDPDPPTSRSPVIDAAQILASRDQALDALTSRLDQSDDGALGRARRKSVSANTREFRYASYLEAWARKVERIGNLNYPQAAREQRMFGTLVLQVAVRSDGSVEQIRVVRSSGFELLDEAAIRIVELAAPFAPFPPDIAAETDVLDIVRTWRFLQGGRLGWER